MLLLLLLAALRLAGGFFTFFLFTSSCFNFSASERWRHQICKTCDYCFYFSLFTFNQSWRARDCRHAPWSVPKNGEALQSAAAQGLLLLSSFPSSSRFDNLPNGRNTTFGSFLKVFIFYFLGRKWALNKSNSSSITWETVKWVCARSVRWSPRRPPRRPPAVMVEQFHLCRLFFPLRVRGCVSVLVPTPLAMSWALIICTKYEINDK